jgi:hypothetical protein
METQYEATEEEDVLRIPRPMVLPRGVNPSIVSANFKLQCAGKVGAGVLEDEMFMSEIVMMSEDIGVKPWHKLPLHIIPSLNIFWEYGVCFPLVRYTAASSLSDLGNSSCTTAAAARNVQFAFVFLHPVRFSMMLWAMDTESCSEIGDEAEDDSWVPEMVGALPLLCLCAIA